ncbi:hypothetical protein D3C87_1860210 [compost metagenome]
MEVIIRQQWAIVAVQTVRLADEELQSGGLLGAECVGILPLRHSVSIGIEA